MNQNTTNRLLKVFLQGFSLAYFFNNNKKTSIHKHIKCNATKIYIADKT